MARKLSPGRLLLDTSAVVYHLHGHTRQQAAVRQAVADRDVWVPVFVRMEYLRGVVLNLIEMWCLIRESLTIDDAFIDWSQRIRQERKLKVILMTVPQWLGAHENWRSKDVTLRRLGISYCGCCANSTRRSRCRSLIRWPAYSVASTSLAKPTTTIFCSTSISDSRRSRRECPTAAYVASAKSKGSGLPGGTSTLGAMPYVSGSPPNPGFIRQSEQVQHAAKTKARTAACSWCERLGDTIIALQANPRVTIVTADRTFVPFGDLLRQTVILLPSLAELKRRNLPDG